MSVRSPFTQSLQSRVRAAAAQTGKNAQQIYRELLHQRILARVSIQPAIPIGGSFAGGRAS